MNEPLHLSIWVSWSQAEASPSVLTSFGWKVLNACEVDTWANLMLEGSPCPEVREAMSVLWSCGCQAEKYPIGMKKQNLETLELEDAQMLL